jgi:hypothetical protein
MLKTIIIIFMASPIVFAQAKKTTPSISPQQSILQADVEAKDVRCEKMNAVSLVDFKEVLVENCNLNKPYSTSFSKMLNDEVYFYCCHKKKVNQ